MRSHGRLRSLLPVLASAPAILLMAAAGHAQSLSGQALSGKALLSALRRGGYVIVMRHASSPREAPDAKTANPDNVNRERQLDAEGRATATAMGKAFRALQIPIGEIDSSPTYRALETVRLAQFGAAKPIPQLGDNGRSMQISTEAQAAWLQAKVKDFPTGTNTLIVTHSPNMSRAFPQWTTGLADGEALIFGPNGKGGATLVARVKIEEWPRLAQ